MSFRFPLVSSVLLCLLALDGGVPVAGSQDPPPPAQPAGQPAAGVRPRMREHFTRGAAIRDAVIRADLEGVREPATWLAEHPQEDLPAAAQPNIGEMQRLSAVVAKAADLPQAARGMAQLAAACGACHTAASVTPTLLAAIPRGEDASLTGQMRKHYRAADLLYRGLVVPSDHSWNRGADALTGDPAELALKLGAAAKPGVEALSKQLNELAQEARKAADPKSRSDVYGRMLATCSDCHKQQNVTIKPGASRF